MSGYKGFIDSDTYADLLNLLRKLADTRGLENKLHHLYQPDTDMDDKICEDFDNSKAMIVTDIIGMVNDTLFLADKIANLKED